MFGAAKFDVNGYDQTVAGLSGPGGTIYNTGTTTDVLTLNSNDNFAFGGSIERGVSIVKQGAGTQDQTYAGYTGGPSGNSYSGTTRIEGGAIYAIDGAVNKPASEAEQPAFRGARRGLVVGPLGPRRHRGRGRAATHLRGGIGGRAAAGVAGSCGH